MTGCLRSEWRFPSPIVSSEPLLREQANAEKITLTEPAMVLSPHASVGTFTGCVEYLAWGIAAKFNDSVDYSE